MKWAIVHASPLYVRVGPTPRRVRGAPGQIFSILISESTCACIVHRVVVDRSNDPHRSGVGEPSAAVGEPSTQSRTHPAVLSHSAHLDDVLQSHIDAWH